MIKYIRGNIFDSNAEALINTVNTVGVMGKGIALQFKKIFPQNFKLYSQACKNGEVEIGKMFVVKENNLETGEKYIINFPTKKDWRKPSEYSFIEIGLNDLIQVVNELNIKSLALPPLGAGNGGLLWEKVKEIIENKLSNIGIEVQVYEPSDNINEQLKKERAKLTNARALLLYVLFDLVKQGEYVSEFAGEKICYFLQRFGAEKYFNLKYEPYFYGPYSGKVRFVFNVLNGSYLLGYSDMNKKPFDPLVLIPGSYNEILEYVKNNQELLEIANKTTDFLNGFYSDFALELMSSIDYISLEYNTYDRTIIADGLAKWSSRKRSLVTETKYIDIILNHLKQADLLNIGKRVEIYSDKE